MDKVKYSLNSVEIEEPYIYRGEGNAHLALALPYIKKVLRIKKCHDNDEIYIRKPDTAKRTSESNLDIRFYREIITPLFMPFVDDLESVYITPDEILRIEDVLSSQRPEHRKHKKLQFGSAALFNDYTFLPFEVEKYGVGPTFSIEIKPKQGGRSREGICLFCEKQKLKFKEGKISNISDYCPLDLFSLDKQDVDHAINALTKSPQNNFKVFTNGELTYGDNFKYDCFNSFLAETFGESNSNSAFCYLIRMALKRQFPRTICPREKQTSHSVLDCLYTVQSFDNRQKLKNILVGGLSYVNKYIKDVENDEHHCPRCMISNYKNEISQLDKYDCDLNDDFITEDLLFSLCIPHYVSRIAKDCSLMVTFKMLSERSDKQIDELRDRIIETEYGDFIFNVKVFDLYPKIPKKVYHIDL